ncbi:MAG: FAD binding domain-containing protein, partial [Spirochaetales bacterium]|nr:FAD binding domain-containing protein [Spirochaetales bacterium]
MGSNGFTPTSLADALEILATERAIPVAGGTDLMVRHRRGGPLPIQLDAPPMFIGRLPELRAVTETASDLTIGAAVTLNDVAAHPSAPPGLTAAIAEFASPAVRNAGTIGGNICNASPAGDTLPYLYAAGATVVLATASTERALPIMEFITGPGQTLLGEDELMTKVIIPRQPAPFVFYRKVAPRRSNALSKLSVYAEAGMDGNSASHGAPPYVTRFRLAVGAAARTVIRIPDAETLIEGATTTEIRDRADELLEAY